MIFPSRARTSSILLRIFSYVILLGAKTTTGDQTPYVGWAMELKWWNGTAYTDTFKDIYGGAVDGTQVTGAGGTYTWNDLQAGDYQITEGDDTAYIHLDASTSKTATLVAGMLGARGPAARALT